MRVALIVSLFLVSAGSVSASHQLLPEVEVLVDGAPVHVYHHQGTTYLEALKGKEYAIRITNPMGIRIAVALSVDGLNTIDARHTEARTARKWVLDPHESIIINGWQTSALQARRFYFTTEARSYGTWLGQADNLGIISAVFYRERGYSLPRPVEEQPVRPPSVTPKSPDSRKEQSQADAVGAAEAKSKTAEMRVAPAAPKDEYAGTGIGNRIRHEVQWVQMDLEDLPFASVNLRYEFRPALVKLGVVPPQVIDDPISRRERARGFRDALYCPEP